MAVRVTGQLNRWCAAAASRSQSELSAELHASAKRVLALAREHLGMQLSWMATISHEVYRYQVIDGDPLPFNLHEGATSALAATYCARVLDGRLPYVVADTAADDRTAALAVTGELNISAYIGAPIRSPQGEVYGMLCCISRHTETSLLERDAKVLAMFAEILADPVATFVSQEGALDGFLRNVERMFDAGGISVALQPIIKVATGDVVAVESLARFASDVYTTEQWFHEAHQAGCGLELELDVITEITSLLPDIPFPLRLGFNASPELIASRRLTDLLESTESDRLTVEMTEHHRFGDVAMLTDGINRLRRLGVLLAIDDAGTGYAGLHRILRLAPDIVKLDRVLILGIDTDPAKQAMVRALTAYADETSTVLLAEGVETQAQLRMLRELGVHLAQGYHLGRPEPLSALLERLAADASDAQVASG